MTAGPPESPRLARALMNLLLPRAEREFVIGDLEETFAVTRPRRNARRGVTRGERASDTTSGVNASHAHAGWPNFGKLSASNAPDRRASA